MKIKRKQGDTHVEVEVAHDYKLADGEELVPASDLERLEALQKGFHFTQQAGAAGNGGVNPGGLPDLDSKDEAILEKERKELHIGTLRNNFSRLSKSCPEFRHLEGNKAMDDPSMYLRGTYTDIRGKRHYVVKDDQLEQMIEVLLLQGSYETQAKGILHGTSVNQWSPKQSDSIAQGFSKGIQMGAFGKPNEARMVMKGLDSGGGGMTSGGPLIRQDIEPILREAYLRKFPLGDLIRRIPANGLVHSYDQRTSPGDATWIDELGDLSETDSQSEFVRSVSSHIGVLGSRRQISLKLQYAVTQSGMSFDLSGAGNLEVVGALSAIARQNQSAIAQGNYSTAAKTKDDEEGATNNKAFDGLRLMLKDAATSITKSVDESYLRVINRAVAQVVNAGGDVDELTILMSLGARLDFDEELINFYRIMNQTPAGGIATNLGSNGIITVADTVSRILPIPAASQLQGLGYYTLGGTATEDIDVIDPKGLAMAYLGSPTPSILELPVGFNNSLSNTYIPFLMNGLVMYITSFHRKIRIPRVVI